MVKQATMVKQARRVKVVVVIRMVPKTFALPTWMIALEGKTQQVYWQELSVAEIEPLEEHFEAGIRTFNMIFQGTTNTIRYVYDLKTMTQTNVKTKCVRRLLRITYQGGLDDKKKTKKMTKKTKKTKKKAVKKNTVSMKRRK